MVVPNSPEEGILPNSGKGLPHPEPFPAGEAGLAEGVFSLTVDGVGGKGVGLHDYELPAFGIRR